MLARAMVHTCNGKGAKENEKQLGQLASRFRQKIEQFVPMQSKQTNHQAQSFSQRKLYSSIVA
jgi:hypothetical protein